MTYSGTQIALNSGPLFDLRAPDHDFICIEDIALGLSNICRWTGQTRVFYSVAQHSVAVSENVPFEHALRGLLHDGHEAYIGDLSSPLKNAVPALGALSLSVEAAVHRRFKISPLGGPEVKRADQEELLKEAAWFELSGFPPRTRFPLYPLTPRQARAKFLQRYYEITGLRPAPPKTRNTTPVALRKTR